MAAPVPGEHAGQGNLSLHRAEATPGQAFLQLPSGMLHWKQMVPGKLGLRMRRAGGIHNGRHTSQMDTNTHPLTNANALTNMLSLIHTDRHLQTLPHRDSTSLTNNPMPLSLDPAGQALPLSSDHLSLHLAHRRGAPGTFGFSAPINSMFCGFLAQSHNKLLRETCKDSRQGFNDSSGAILLTYTSQNEQEHQFLKEKVF